MNKWIWKILFLTGLIVMAARADSDADVLFQVDGFVFLYDLSTPSQKQDIDDKLDEISGMSHIEGDRFACIQDEDGVLFILDFETGQLEDQFKFGKDGDYEGVTLVDDTAYVLKSNGVLYQIGNYQGKKKDRKVRRFETRLSKRNDTEGLTYDAKNNRLLIACKGKPFFDQEKKGEHQKSIYAFDFMSKTLSEEPVYLIHLDPIKSLRHYNWMAKAGLRLLSFVDIGKGDLTFQPSDLAVHPLTDNIYVIGAVGDLLIVLNPEGIPLIMVDLDDRLFKKPEGICFKPDGTLYISNEGEDQEPNMLEFNMRGFNGEIQ